MMPRVSLRAWAYRATVVLTFAFVVAPLLVVVWVSVFANRIVGFPPTGYTLHWYAKAWQLVDFREGFLTTMQVGVAATAIGMLFGVPAALVLARGRFPGKDFINALLLSPMMIPGVVAGSGMYVYYIQVELRTDVQLVATLPGLVAAHAILALPWVIRLATISLQAVSESVEEAAMSLGASPSMTLWRVTLPMARPGLVAGALFAFIVSFTDLEKSLFLVGPGRTTLQIAIFNYLEWNLDPTIAAVATAQIAIVALALIVSDRYVKLSRVF